MLTYKYRAQTTEGKELRGIVQAVDEYDAVRRIRSDAPIIIDLQPVKEKGGSILSMEIGGNRVSQKNLSIVCRQIAIALRAGIPLARCLAMIGEQTPDKMLRRMLTETAEDVAAGNSVADCMARNCPALPPTFIETIRAGEDSGNIERSFAEMAGYYEKSYRNADRLRQAMAYPIFVVAVAVVVLIIVMVMVVPALTQTFEDLGGELPFITRLLIAVSRFFRKWWALMAITALLLYLGVTAFFRTERGRGVQGKLLLRLPVLGKINVMSGSAQFAATLGMLLKSGLTLNTAIPTTARTMSNYVLGRDVAGIQERIESGRPLGECIRDCVYFPKVLQEMCAIGEETGELDETLDVIGDFYTNEADMETKKAIDRLEPALLILLALFAGFIVLAVYLPMFTMYNLM
ncbi:type II secretion system F family protein [Lachnoclostridium sp. Marseille-P6806]|uniref:type II secretion system F family protein n=1 Tax=Lachnoclostridium sp. Marseille-P6806 TaxID=2364793 RepID=UPI00103089E0|nr:type II secretion system F family protein [Lachnoclostridium sp. Marseille-P6806]